MSLVAGTRLGVYEVLSLLGAGGMGEVYRARDTRLDRTVAIKVLPSHLADRPDLRERLEREARAVSRSAVPAFEVLRCHRAASVGPGSPAGRKLGPLATKILFGSIFASNTRPMKQLLISSQF